MREYLDENQVGTATLVEKFELVEAAEVNHARTGKVNRALRERRDQITDAFANVALAYETLSDPKKRQMYDLTGEWGQEKEVSPLLYVVLITLMGGTSIRHFGWREAIIQGLCVAQSCCFFSSR